MSNEPRSAVRVYLMSAAFGLCSGAVAAAVGVPITVRLAGWEGVAGLAAGCGVSLVANLIGLLPVAFLFGRDHRNLATGVLAGMAVRFFLTLLLALPVALTGWVPPAAFLIWVAISYLVILFAETTIIVVTTERHEEAKP